MTQDLTNIEELRYPIGQFEWGKDYTEEEIQQLIETIEKFPARLKMLLLGFAENDLEMPYRDGGWNVRQIVHHVADSHINAYTRFKLALTEEKPTIKPYNEKSWAELIDSRTMPVSVSLNLLAAIHERWTTILKAMKEEHFRRELFHPQHLKMHSLVEMLAMYAWHSNHHYEHIQLVKKALPAVSKPPRKKAEPKKAAAKSVKTSRAAGKKK
jgi:hypothetical protein